MNHSLAALLACFLCLFFSVQSAAGAWPVKAGEGQIISTSQTGGANFAYGPDSNADIAVDFSKLETAIYWEHGILPNATLVLQTSLQDIAFTAGVDNIKYQGFGESIIGLRGALWQGERSVVSGQFSVIIPSAGETISDADLGFGAVNYEMKLLAGRSFKAGGRDGFVDIQASWRLRPGQDPDELRLDGTLGWRPTEKTQILGQAFYAKGNGKFGIARENSRLKLQGSALIDRGKASYQIGVYQTVKGRNIVKENAIFISVWRRY